jgi:hypothetical protein
VNGQLHTPAALPPVPILGKHKSEENETRNVGRINCPTLVLVETNTDIFCLLHPCDHGNLSGNSHPRLKLKFIKETWYFSSNQRFSWRCHAFTTKYSFVIANLPGIRARAVLKSADRSSCTFIQKRKWKCQVVYLIKCNERENMRKELIPYSANGWTDYYKVKCLTHYNRMHNERLPKIAPPTKRKEFGDTGRPFERHTRIQSRLQSNLWRPKKEKLS